MKFWEASVFKLGSHAHDEKPAKQAHQPVLLDPAIQALRIDPHAFYVDATYGRGGHSREILCHLAADGYLLAFDKDPAACRHARMQFGADARFEIRQNSFAGMQQLAGEACMGQIAGVLFDLGVSSPQIEDPERGFSFQKKGLLDMRMNPEDGISALQWLNSASVWEIETVLRTYGEERNAAKIARAIKRSSNLRTTFDLADLVTAVSRKSKRSGKNPATRTFLALRLYINHELEDLRAALSALPALLRTGGRLAVITFHSLEDRIVKQFIQRFSSPRHPPAGLPGPDDYSQVCLKKVGRPVVAGTLEVSRNPRARSARLRIAEKILPSPHPDV